MSGARTQINVRLSQELIEQLDQKRIALQPELGMIPTRSDVMRYALEAYLNEGKPGKKKTAKK